MIRTHRRDGVAVVELDDPPVNALGDQLRTEFAGELDALEADREIAAIVITGVPGTFSGGADIRGFGRPVDPDAVTLPELLMKIERSTKRFYAAIDGIALGGGYELALACDKRIARSGSRVGLPEINLGLLPGAGGTQRLPRLIGIAAALGVITSGKPVAATRALELGMIDALVDGDPVEAAVALAREEHGGPRRRASDRVAEPDADAIAAARAKAEPAERGGLAAQRCIDAIAASCDATFEDGLLAERHFFLELKDSEQSRSRVHVFFAEREAVKIPGMPSGLAAGPVMRAVVIGAGTMGGGIAMALADGGVTVHVVEAAADALARGRATIERNYATSMKRGRLSAADVDARMGRLTFGTDLAAAAADTDVVIEAVFENVDVKRNVFAELDRMAKPGTLLATNTSTIDIDTIAGATSRPADVIGLHFFSPANVMRLLEIVRGTHTSHAAIAAAFALAKRIKKVGVLARSCDGFIGNRMLAPYRRESVHLVEEGATPQDVDRVVRAFGFAMGPFAMGDLAGLDIGWHIKKRRIAEGRMPPGRDPEIIDRLCEMGRFGQKTGAGVYRYADGDRTPQVDPVTDGIVAAESARLGIERRTVSDDEIRERLILALVNEGANTIADGTAIRPGDVDVVWVYGYGFPAWRGGPMHYADTLGLGNVRDALHRLAETHGERWTPSPLIDELAASGRHFDDLTAESLASPAAS